MRAVYLFIDCLAIAALGVAVAVGLWLVGL
jgi:hypothetical protein